MKERPILFSAPMVRAILEGQKTQTRRVVKPEGAHHLFPFLDLPGNPTGEWAWCSSSHVVSKHILCPYGQPGDRLWVRETWAPEQIDADAMTMQDVTDSVRMPAYRADFEGVPAYRWRPSIHMPRWASRILLEIVSVRVERLNNISESDSLAEGVSATGDGAFHLEADGFRSPTASETFARLWESINGAGSWESNPWVWAVEFRKTP